MQNGDLEFLERLDRIIDRFCDSDGGLLEDVVSALEMKLDCLRDEMRAKDDGDDD